MENNGFSGWVKWVIVIAALITISNTLYDCAKAFVNGFERGYSSGSHQTSPDPKP